MMQVFIDEVNAYIDETSAENMQEFILPLKHAIVDISELTQEVLIKSSANPNELGSAANDYLHVFGYTAMAFVWAKMAEVSLGKQQSGDSFYLSKIQTARYYFARMLPRTQSLILAIKAGSQSLFDIDDDLF